MRWCVRGIGVACTASPARWARPSRRPVHPLGAGSTSSDTLGRCGLAREGSVRVVAIQMEIKLHALLCVRLLVGLGLSPRMHELHVAKAKHYVSNMPGFMHPSVDHAVGDDFIWNVDVEHKIHAVESEQLRLDTQ